MHRNFPESSVFFGPGRGPTDLEDVKGLSAPQRNARDFVSNNLPSSLGLEGPFIPPPGLVGEKGIPLRGRGVKVFTSRPGGVAGKVAVTLIYQAAEEDYYGAAELRKDKAPLGVGVAYAVTGLRPGRLGGAGGVSPQHLGVRGESSLAGERSMLNKAVVVVIVILAIYGSLTALSVWGPRWLGWAPVGLAVALVSATPLAAYRARYRGISGAVLPPQGAVRVRSEPDGFWWQKIAIVARALDECIASGAVTIEVGGDHSLTVSARDGWGSGRPFGAVEEEEWADQPGVRSFSPQRRSVGATGVEVRVLSDQTLVEGPAGLLCGQSWRGYSSILAKAVLGEAITPGGASSVFLATNPRGAKTLAELAMGGRPTLHSGDPGPVHVFLSKDHDAVHCSAGEEVVLEQRGGRIISRATVGCGVLLKGYGFCPPEGWIGPRTSGGICDIVSVHKGRGRFSGLDRLLGIIGFLGTLSSGWVVFSGEWGALQWVFVANALAELAAMAVSLKRLMKYGGDFLLHLSDPFHAALTWSGAEGEYLRLVLWLEAVGSAVGMLFLLASFGESAMAVPGWVGVLSIVGNSIVGLKGRPFFKGFSLYFSELVIEVVLLALSISGGESNPWLYAALLFALCESLELAWVGYEVARAEGALTPGGMLFFKERPRVQIATLPAITCGWHSALSSFGGAVSDLENAGGLTSVIYVEGGPRSVIHGLSLRRFDQAQLPGVQLGDKVAHATGAVSLIGMIIALRPPGGPGGRSCTLNMTGRDLEGWVGSVPLVGGPNVYPVLATGSGR